MEEPGIREEWHIWTVDCKVKRGFSPAQRVHAPNPYDVQGSTVLNNLESLPSKVAPYAARLCHTANPSHPTRDLKRKIGESLKIMFS